MPDKNCPQAIVIRYSPREIESLKNFVVHPDSKEVLKDLGEVISSVDIVCCRRMSSAGVLHTPCYQKNYENCPISD